MALVGCGAQRIAADAPRGCVAGAAECPIRLAFTANRTEARGTLSAERSSVSYAFEVQTPAQLQWVLLGPAVRVVLTGPDGNADGPGLPPTVPLATAGRYVFSVSSNTMAENIYGAFRLELRLSPSG